MKPTKEEISLCKRVAEKHRKKIKCGDWILRNGELRLNLDGKLAWLEDGKQDIIITITAKEEIIPLWTISDCLEFLRRSPKIQTGERVWDIIKFKAYVSIRPFGTHKGETVLGACLKAVLAVLEEVPSGAMDK